MGCGKSTCGRTLSKELLLPYMDTDKEIERRTGKKISEIFVDSGEEYFRSLETSLLEELSEGTEYKDGVISLGGGCPVRDINRLLFRRIGTVVYLRATPELLIKRLMKSRKSRPLLQTEDPEKKILELFNYRDPLYMDAADYVLEIDDMDLTQEVNQLKLICHNRSSLKRREH